MDHRKVSLCPFRASQKPDLNAVTQTERIWPAGPILMAVAKRSPAGGREPPCIPPSCRLCSSPPAGRWLDLTTRRAGAGRSIRIVAPVGHRKGRSDAGPSPWRCTGRCWCEPGHRPCWLAPCPAGLTTRGPGQQRPSSCSRSRVGVRHIGAVEAVAATAGAKRADGAAVTARGPYPLATRVRDELSKLFTATEFAEVF